MSINKHPIHTTIEIVWDFMAAGGVLIITEF